MDPEGNIIMFDPSGERFLDEVEEAFKDAEISNCSIESKGKKLLIVVLKVLMK